VKDFELNVIKGAGLGQIPDNISGDGTYLPKPVSDKIIEEILHVNVMRKFVQVIPVSAKNITVPTVIYGVDDSINAYKVSYGTDVRTGNSEAGFTTGGIVLTPQLLVVFNTVLEHDLETAGLDLAKYIMKTLTQTIAKAEEACLVRGSENASSNSYLSLFNGIYTIAADATLCAQTPITFSASDDRVAKIADAIKSLGALGDDRGSLVLVVSNTFANALRKSDKIITVGDYAPREASAIRTGILPRIHGVDVIESSQLEAAGTGDVAVLMRKDGGLLGQRGKIIFRKKVIEESFSQLLIMAEEIDFEWGFKNTSDKALGIVLIKPSAS